MLYPYNTKKRHRRSICLKYYDYTQPGYYFITICINHRENILGTIENGEKKLSKFGKLAEVYWLHLPKPFSNIKLDEYIYMPNHIHGIIQIIETADLHQFAQVEKSGSVSHSINAIFKTINLSQPAKSIK